VGPDQAALRAGTLLSGSVLGPTLEKTCVRAMLLGRGYPTVFLIRPVSLTLL
jgi:putative tricarboxylic transport membrane protein